MAFYVVKVLEKNVGLHAPIIAVGDKEKSLEKLKSNYGHDAEIEFGPEEDDFSKFGLLELTEGIHPLFDMIWDEE